MSTSLSAKFDTRREAEMTVERLVQQFKIDRTHVFIAAEGDENTVGVEEAGSDTEAGGPGSEDRDDAQLAGRVVVTDLADPPERRRTTCKAGDRFRLQRLTRLAALQLDRIMGTRHRHRAAGGSAAGDHATRAERPLRRLVAGPPSARRGRRGASPPAR